MRRLLCCIVRRGASLPTSVGNRNQACAFSFAAALYRSTQTEINLWVPTCWHWIGSLSPSESSCPRPRQKFAARGYTADDTTRFGWRFATQRKIQELCKLACIQSKTNLESGDDSPWLLKDLRKTCATYCDQHLPESAIEILGHSVGGITYRHYAHRSPLPQPKAFATLTKGFEGKCPCCRRSF